MTKTLIQTVTPLPEPSDDEIFNMMLAMVLQPEMEESQYMVVGNSPVRVIDDIDDLDLIEED
jgi:hypothetical protein